MNKMESRRSYTRLEDVDEEDGNGPTNESDRDGWTTRPKTNPQPKPKIVDQS